MKRCSSRASLASSLKKGINNPANNCIVARELFRTFGLTCCTRLHTCIFLFSIFPGGKFRFVNSLRNTNATYVSREKRIFSFKSVLLLSESQFRFVTLEGCIHIYVYICITIGKSGRSKTRFPRWEKYFSTLGDTYLSSWEADTRTDAYPNLHLQRDGEEIATVRIEFLFSSAGEYWHRCGSSSPFRALLAKSVVGPIYDDKGEEGGGKEKKGREERDAVGKVQQFDGRKQTVGGSAARGGGGTRGGVIQGVPLISSRKIGHEMH